MLPEYHAVLSLLEGGFNNLRILVIGDLMLDRYILGEVDRVSPEAPVPVLRHAQRYSRAGGAANVAMNLAGLGCQSFLAGFWGHRTPSRQSLPHILEAAHGVDTLGVVTSSRCQLISKTRIVGRTAAAPPVGYREPPISRPQLEEVDRLQEHARSSSSAKSTPMVSSPITAKGRAHPTRICRSGDSRRPALHGIPVLVDPKRHRFFSKYTGATTVCPNLQRASSRATGISPCTAPTTFSAAGRMLVTERFGIEFLTVTMQRARASPCFDPAETSYHSPARAREVFDVSGAGDTVIATIAGRVAGRRTCSSTPPWTSPTSPPASSSARSAPCRSRLP